MEDLVTKKKNNKKIKKKSVVGMKTMILTEQLSGLYQTDNRVIFNPDGWIPDLPSSTTHSPTPSSAYPLKASINNPPSPFSPIRVNHSSLPLSPEERNS
ncbi:hypothetical protein L2E82_32908 [Cichorium intybus]|uniref:Uncharacterized protein n=1 Tax=Cichorium intybus TaxID=13427 RepID=A0ACB9BH77_CICIN|nr:hypothetical protein L2E82_32908 [Cichorium intybus]